MNPSSMMHPAVPLNCVFTMLLSGLVLMGTPTSASSIMSQCRFDPDGYFYIKGGPSRGFEELDHIQLQVKAKPTLDSRLSAKDGRSYRFTNLAEFRTHSSGTGITFEFTTEIIDGVNYQFSGKFRSICVLAQDEREPEHVVAVGRLQKFQKGQQKAAADVELTYSQSLRREESRQSTDASKPTDGTGREVLAVLSKIERKAYTDDLPDGKVLVSDIFRFEVREPKELKHVTITAYYRGAPNVQGRRLQVGDLVRFELPPEVQRDGIFLGDLKALRFRE